MKALVQRVIRGSVSVGDSVVGHIDRGLVVLLGVGRDDTADDAEYLARKVIGLRVFQNGQAEFDLSVVDIGGGVLAVSQFTLMAETGKGRRPSFTEAAPPDVALPLYQKFVDALRANGATVESGVFQEYMLVEILNDGPVTVMLDSKSRKMSRTGRPE